MVEARHQEVMTITSSTKINGVLQRMGTTFSFLEISLCVGVERRIVDGKQHIPQAFLVLTSKTQLLFAYLTLIST